jgi:transcriptional regulator of aroF, aroG, tyrA and aromatic amino acid transport
LTIPPLRERPEDIPPLVEYFLAAATKDGLKKTLCPETRAYLQRLPWRGNVRELRHAVHRAIALGGEVLTPEDFAETPVSTRPTATVADLLALPSWDDIERMLVTEALTKYGSVGRLVKALRLPRSTIYDRLRRWGISARNNGGCLCHQTTGSTLPS